MKPSSSGPPTISDFCHIEFNNIPARHDWGGYVAITAATLHPNVFRRVAVLCVPHMRAFKLLPLMQLVRSWYVFLSTSSKDTPNTPFQVRLFVSNSFPPLSTSTNLELCIHRPAIPHLEPRLVILRVSLRLGLQTFSLTRLSELTCNA